MYIPRRDQRYGGFNPTASFDGVSNWYTNPATPHFASLKRNQRTGPCFRAKPVKGKRSLEGLFRLPTAWQGLASTCEYFTVFQQFRPPGSTVWEYRGSTGSSAYPTPDYFGFDGTGATLLSVNSDNRARTEAIEKVKNQKINVGSTIGEAHATIEQLLTAADRVSRLIRALRRKDFAQAASVIGVPSKHYRGQVSPGEWWLEFRYGWLPLLSDVYGLQEQVKDMLTQKPLICNVRRTVTDGYDGKRVFLNAKDWDQTHDSVFQSIRYTYWFRISDPFRHLLAQLGVSNPLAVAWELLPYSFVVDWFFPLGTYLSALDATVGTTFVSGERLIRTYGDVTLRVYARDRHYLSQESGEGKIRYRFYAWNRTPLTGFGEPMPYVKSPFSSTHMTSAIALLKQATKR